MSFSKRMLGEDGGPGFCAQCGKPLDAVIAVSPEGDEVVDTTVTRRFGGATWKVHTTCAEIVDQEAKHCSDEHDWPGDLDDDAECSRCGLRYDDWTVEV